MKAVEVFDGDLPEIITVSVLRADIVGWDIETSGLDWRDDNIGTCQLHAPNVGTYIVRRMTTRPSNLVSILNADSVVKVFHHAPFDLRFIQYHWAANPRQVRCTKVASKLLQPDSENDEHSLKALLARRLNIAISKEERLSDWLAADLSPKQIDYAAADVRHLADLLSALMGDLYARGLGALYAECCRFLPSRAQLEIGEFPDVFRY